MKEIPISLFLFLSNFISVPKELAILLIWTAISTYLISDLIHLPLNQLLLSPDSLLLLLLLATFCCCHVPIKSQIGRDSSALCRSSNYRLAITGHRHTHTHTHPQPHTRTRIHFRKHTHTEANKWAYLKTLTRCITEAARKKKKETETVGGVWWEGGEVEVDKNCATWQQNAYYA